MVGMSLGGLTTIALAQEAPDLVRRSCWWTCCPGSKASGPSTSAISSTARATFPSFEDLLELTVQFNPTRSVSSLRRGILHNAEQQEDGTWVWRWARHRPAVPAAGDAGADPDAGVVVTSQTATDSFYDRLWQALGSVTVPVLLARGMRADSVLGDEDEEELRRRLPSAQVVHVEGAGHSLQGDTPLELAALIEAFVFEP